MPDGLGLAVKIILLVVGYWTAINFGIAFLVAYLLPACFFRPTHRYYREKPFERALYRGLHVSRWKDLLPEAGVLIGFSKKNLQSTKDIAYLKQFIVETRKTELLHLLVGVLGYSFVLLAYCFRGHETLCFWLFLAAATLDFVIQLMYVCIQRYNRPRFERLLARRLARLERSRTENAVRTAAQQAV